MIHRGRLTVGTAALLLGEMMVQLAACGSGGGSNASQNRTDTANGATAAESSAGQRTTTTTEAVTANQRTTTTTRAVSVDPNDPCTILTPADLKALYSVITVNMAPPPVDGDGDTAYADCIIRIPEVRGPSHGQPTKVIYFTGPAPLSALDLDPGGFERDLAGVGAPAHFLTNATDLLMIEIGQRFYNLFIPGVGTEYGVPDATVDAIFTPLAKLIVNRLT
jgi:hypothetical protein